MKNEDGKIVYSEEDKKHIVVKQYLASELEKKESQYGRKRNIRRIFFALTFFLLVVISGTFVQIQFACYIALAFMIFLVVLYEVIDRTNKKAILRQCYFEVEIDKVLPTETCVDGTLTPGSDISVFYPVEARDTTSGYKSRIYLDAEQYRTAKVGDVVRISTKEDKL